MHSLQKIKFYNECTNESVKATSTERRVSELFAKK